MFSAFLKIARGRGIVLRSLSIFMLTFLSGCGDFFEKKTTELETRRILTDLAQPREIPGLKNPLPEIYRSGPTRIPVSDGVKLFYFTKHHSVKDLEGLVKSQLGNKVAHNSATNQLIVHCKDDTEADKVLEYLGMIDVPPIQVNIDCLVVERFADVTLDWETTLLMENLFGEAITLGESKFPDPAFPGAALREGARREFGLDFGFWRNKGITGHQFRGIVDVLESRGYLKILMNPQLEVVNGKKAYLLSRENAPLQKIIFKPGLDEPFETTEYQWVADTLEVTPHVYADGSIGLETKVQIGSKSKPEGVIQVSIITERAVEVKENRIKPGDSLIIGGLRKSEKRSVIRGIPFFKDIPVAGVLFSSKDFEEKATEIIFILTPSVSSGGTPYEEILEDVREKHETPTYETGWEEAIIDPFGRGAYTEQIKGQATEAEYKRRQAEMEKSQALEQLQGSYAQLQKLTEQLMQEKSKTEEAQTETEAIKAKLKKAEQDIKNAQQRYEHAKTEAEKARQLVEKLKKEAQQAKKVKPQPPKKNTNQNKKVEQQQK